MARFQVWMIKSTIEEGEECAVVFGQNINNRKQHKAQSSHYNRKQSTIFPFVSLFYCNQTLALVTHEICCISDDLKHDAYAVRAFELVAIEILKQHV